MDWAVSRNSVVMEDFVVDVVAVAGYVRRMEMGILDSEFNELI